MSFVSLLFFGEPYTPPEGAVQTRVHSLVQRPAPKAAHNPRKDVIKIVMSELIAATGPITATDIQQRTGVNRKSALEKLKILQQQGRVNVGKIPSNNGRPHFIFTLR